MKLNSPQNSPGESKDPNKWVIVQLTQTGEKESDLDSIKRSVHRILGRKDLEVFIPAVSEDVRGESHTTFYMDGYIFVKFAEGVHFHKLQETNYFSSVLCSVSQKKREYSFLYDKDLLPMKEGISNLQKNGLRVGQNVKVNKGEYKNLIGEVSFIYENGQDVQVYIGLRSKKILMDFPSSYLDKSLYVL